RLDALAAVAAPALAIAEPPAEQHEPEKPADALFGVEPLVSDDRQRREPADDQADADEQPAPEVRGLRLRQAADRAAGLRLAVLGHRALRGVRGGRDVLSMAGNGRSRQ